MKTIFKTAFYSSLLQFGLCQTRRENQTVGTDRSDLYLGLYMAIAGAVGVVVFIIVSTIVICIQQKKKKEARAVPPVQSGNESTADGPRTMSGKTMRNTAFSSAGSTRTNPANHLTTPRSGQGNTAHLPRTIMTYTDFQ